MQVPGSKIVPHQGVLGSNHSLTFGLFTQVSGLGPLGPLVSEKIRLDVSSVSSCSTEDSYEKTKPYFLEKIKVKN